MYEIPAYTPLHSWGEVLTFPLQLQIKSINRYAASDGEYGYVFVLAPAFMAALGQQGSQEWTIKATTVDAFFGIAEPEEGHPAFRAGDIKVIDACRATVAGYQEDVEMPSGVKYWIQLWFTQAAISDVITDIEGKEFYFDAEQFDLYVA